MKEKKRKMCTAICSVWMNGQITFLSKSKHLTIALLKKSNKNSRKMYRLPPFVLHFPLPSEAYLVLQSFSYICFLWKEAFKICMFSSNKFSYENYKH